MPTGGASAQSGAGRRRGSWRRRPCCRRRGWPRCCGARRSPAGPRPGRRAGRCRGARRGGSCGARAGPRCGRAGCRQSEPVSGPCRPPRPGDRAVEIGLDRVGYGALAPGRALDLAEADEVVEQALALGGGGALERANGHAPEATGAATRATRPDRGLDLGRALARPFHRRPTKSRNSGCGRSGRDLNSGWYCEATKKGWSGQLDHLDETVVGRRAAEDQAGVLQPLAQVVVHLVAVAVALVDDGLAVDLAGARALVQLHRVGAQAHRAAHVAHFLLLGQEVDHREGRLGVELGRVGPVHAGHVAGELGHGDLHAEADAEVRARRSRARSGRRWILPSMPRTPKPPGTRMPSQVASSRSTSPSVEPLGVDPATSIVPPLRCRRG